MESNAEQGETNSAEAQRIFTKKAISKQGF